MPEGVSLPLDSLSGVCRPSALLIWKVASKLYLGRLLSLDCEKTVRQKIARANKKNARLATYLSGVRSLAQQVLLRGYSQVGEIAVGGFGH